MEVNKGDEIKFNVRSRIVGRELKAQTREALLPHELFSAMPPWEAVKLLFSMLVTDDLQEIFEDLTPEARSLLDQEELEIGIFDISRAHFMPEAKRELYIEVPEEDKHPDRTSQQKHVWLPRC